MKTYTMDCYYHANRDNIEVEINDQKYHNLIRSIIIYIWGIDEDKVELELGRRRLEVLLGCFMTNTCLVDLSKCYICNSVCQDS